MAEAVQKQVEREYIIPLRNNSRKVPRYKKASKGIKSIKEFVAKHMKVRDRDTRKIKLDSYLNNELWFRGSRNVVSKVKVKVRKEGDVVKVELAQIPERIKFLKAKQEKRHKKVEKKKPVEDKKEEKVEEQKTEEEKNKEKEKEKSVEEANIKIAEKAAKAQKHTVQTQKGPQVQRKALKK